MLRVFPQLLGRISFSPSSYGWCGEGLSGEFVGVSLRGALSSHPALSALQPGLTFSVVGTRAGWHLTHLLPEGHLLTVIPVRVLVLLLLKPFSSTKSSSFNCKF